MIGWYVHHHGAGHAQRFAAVSRYLRTPVTAFSSAPRPAGFDGEWVQLACDDTEPVDRVSATAGGELHWAPLHHDGVSARNATLAAWISLARPRLFVTDVSVEATVLARLCGVPVVVAAMLGDRDDAPHRLGRSMARALLAPWPEPREPSGGGTPVVHVGAFSRFDGRPATGVPASRSVLVLWGSGGRDVGDEEFRRSQEATPGWTWEFRVPGSPLSSDSSDDVWEALQRNEVVIVHGGHNAVAEVAAARRAAVVVAQERPFAEQLRRVELLRAEGLTALDAWPDAAQWPQLLERARAVGAGPWKRWAPGDGAQRAAQFLDELVLSEGRPDAVGVPS